MQRVEALYTGAITNALNKDKNARSGYMDFYRYIHHVRYCLDSADWEAFFRRLLLCIASSCETLQQNSAALQGNTRSTRLDDNHEYLGREQAGRAYSQSPSLYDTEPQSSPGRPTSSSSFRSMSRVTPSAVNISNGTNLPQYTTVLKEHLDVQGGSLKYTYKELSSIPSVWRCVASLDGIKAYATGQNKQEAKHAASRQMCQSLGLDIY